MGIFNYLLVQKPQLERQAAKDAEARQLQESQAKFRGGLEGQDLSQMGMPQVLDLVRQQEQVGIEGGVLQDQLDFLQSQVPDDADAGFQGGTFNPRDYTTESYTAALRASENGASVAEASSMLERFDEPANPFGSVGTGMVRVPDGQGGIRDVPIPGGAEYQRRVAPIDNINTSIEQIDAMLAQIEDTGGDSFGADAKKQGVLHTQVMASLGQLTNMGVLQPAEAERLASSLVNPTDFMSRLRTNDTLKAPYELLRKQLMDKQTKAIRGLTGSAPSMASPRPDQPPPVPEGYILRGQ